MRILVVDQCSNKKNVPDDTPSFDVDQLEAMSRDELLADERVPARPARNLYAGRQQRYISEAVDRLRNAGDDVTRVFISAGFGVVEETTELPAYDVTFADYTTAEVETRAAGLGIPDDIRQLVAADRPYDIVFLALGTDYYRSIDLPAVLDAIPVETTVVVFNQEEHATARDNVISVPARTEQAKQLETIVVALKGQYMKHFAEHRAHGVEMTTQADIAAACQQEYTTQTGLTEFDG